MDISNLKGRMAVVTGAASGIGRETALALARRGADLAVCDINAAALDAFAGELEKLGGKVIRQRVDVAERGDMERFAAAVHGEVEAVDVLVNNAGVGLGGGFLHTGLDDWDWVIGINLKGVIHGCHFFLPPMVEKRAGHVVNVASAAGLVATEALAAYSTTKFAVVGLSEALRDELAQFGIGVTAICPGIINTPITQSSRIVGPLATEQNRQEVIAAYQKRNYGPERVAHNILRAIERERAVAPVSPEAWALYYAKRFVPGLLGRFTRAMGARERKRRETGVRSGD
jgi:NAD(P)-dependent dehydrogenase (short-subunit alcohol dehydrogenase family)